MELNGKIHHRHFNSEKLGFKRTIFEENRDLLIKYKGINLSGGYPEWDTPKFVKEALGNATFQPNENHYSECAGQLDLRKTIALNYKSVFNQDLDGDKNVLIGEGGTGIIFQLFFSLIKPGDEVIFFEPFFQYFYFNAKMAGANIKYCEFIPKNGQWIIDFEKLESLFSNKTRLIIINSPHNPTGKVFTKEELLTICKILKRFPDVIVMADEVYEKCVYDNEEFPRIGTFEGMWDRTITILSSGKTFNVTGWRVGYAIADESLINAMIAAQRSTVFCVNRPCSAAVASMIVQGNEPYEEYPTYYQYHNSMLQKSKDLLLKGFSQIPQIQVFPPKGGYFFTICIENLIKYIPKKHFYKDGNEILNGSDPVNGFFENLKDPDFPPAEACFLWLAKEIGVNMIPLDSFYFNEDRDLKDFKGKTYLRVSVTAKPESIEKAMQRMQKALNNLK